MSDYAELEKRLRTTAAGHGDVATADMALHDEAAAAISELTRDKKDLVIDLTGLERALEEWPKLPPLQVLRNLGGHMAKWPEDWERGKAMQNELGLDVIPPKTEYECGAGLWDRITNGAWRNCLSSEQK